jgi:hypothetical protein
VEDRLYHRISQERWVGVREFGD